MKRLVESLVILSVVILITACGESGSTKYGNVTGTVVVPHCPGLTYSGKTCPSRPAPGIRIDFVNLSTNSSAVAVTDETGRYAIRLPSGSYRISLEIGALPSYGPNQVVVEEGRVATANFSYEVGTG
jgi:hypothetical protein